ncbi:MAG: glycosyltransferase family 4 protein [Nitrospirae bacterium]|nr:glycosyltransferase family 4 protein [Nitrospirota bacterium]
MKCGVGHYTFHLANALAKSGKVTVGILTGQAAGSSTRDVDFEIIPIVETWKLTEARKILKKIQSWHPDVVHVQFPTQGYGNRVLPWILTIFLQIKKFPMVQTWHEYYLKGGKRNILNAFTSGGLIVVRPKYKEMMPRWYRNLIKHKIYKFIPNASAIPAVQLIDVEKEAIQMSYARKGKSMIVYFGFVFPHKGVDTLFKVANPEKHHLVFICDLKVGDSYQERLLDTINSPPWKGAVTVTGYLSDSEVARILAAADAVVLPFREGAGIWNTTVHAAEAQGTFILTTSCDKTRGYNETENIYYALPNDITDMQKALDLYSGRKRQTSKSTKTIDWNYISNEHYNFYQALLDSSHP